MGSLLTAVQFLTIIPIPRMTLPSERALSSSVAYFPLVGALIGALVAGLDLLTRVILPSFVADVTAVLALALLTGALHLDGLADTCDGVLAPGREATERLAIMRDSHIGAFGALGLILVLLAKLAAISHLDPAARPLALIAAGAVSRWAIVYTYRAHPYARTEPSLSAKLKLGATRPAFGLASAIACGLVLPLGGAGLLCFLAVAALAAFVGRWITARIGGITGDVCGAICEVSEVFALLAIPPLLALL